MESELLGELEPILSTFIGLLRFILESLATLTIFWGLLRTLQHALKIRRKKGGRQPVLAYPFEFSEIRLTFGLWLALALEFQLAADVLSTTVSLCSRLLIDRALTRWVGPSLPSPLSPNSPAADAGSS